MIKICYLSEYEVNTRWLFEASKLLDCNSIFLDVPVGAIIVNKSGVRCSEGINEVNRKCDPTFHAEIVAIRKLSKILGKTRFKGYSIYSTMKPCLMCLTLILNTFISRVFYILIPEKIWPTFKKSDYSKLLNWNNSSDNKDNYHIVEEKLGPLRVNRIYNKQLNNSIKKNMQDYFIQFRK